MSLLFRGPLVLLLAVSGGAAAAVGPSFDCAKSDGEIEGLICQDEELAALDRALAAVYQTAQKNIPAEEFQTVKETQRGWIKGRNDCWKAGDKKACARANYEQRITELQIAAGAVEVPAPVIYRCDGGDTVTAYFYQDTQLPAAVLNRVPDQVLAFISPSGSGAKYQGLNVTFWEQGGEAQVSWRGDELRCTAQAKP